MKLEYIMTTFVDQKEEKLTKQLLFKPDQGEENQLLNLYPQVRYQSFEGFGGALTESAGYVYSLMNRDYQQKLITEYFSKENMNYLIVRIPIDSCDFSLGHYEAVSQEQDINFETFQLERVEKTILPLLDEAQKKCGEALEIMLTPWSPPSFMKTNGERNNGGKLKKEYYKSWAEYICKYINEYRKRGYKVTRISLQNEPKAKQTWDSCEFCDEEEKEFLKAYMWPSLQENGLTDIEIFIWDHNKERSFERACAIIDEETSHMITGIAFHWYSGDHFEALRMISEKFPDKKLILSEACIEYNKYSQDDYLNNAKKYAHDIIGNLNNGMHAFYDWNIVLDEKGGPNHVGNYCDAPYLYDTDKQKLIRRNSAAYLWHFSNFIRKNAVRIGFSKYTDKLEVTAFKNEDDRLAVVILNQTKEEIPLFIRIKEEYVSVTIKPEAIFSGIIEE
jgi:glucosylceramidase